MKQLKTPDDKVLYSHFVLVSKAVEVWDFWRIDKGAFPYLSALLWLLICWKFTETSRRELLNFFLTAAVTSVVFVSTTWAMSHHKLNPISEVFLKKFFDLSVFKISSVSSCEVLLSRLHWAALCWAHPCSRHRHPTLWLEFLLAARALCGLLMTWLTGDCLHQRIHLTLECLKQLAESLLAFG